jgi:hypothetical protein
VNRVELVDAEYVMDLKWLDTPRKISAVELTNTPVEPLDSYVKASNGRAKVHYGTSQSDVVRLEQILREDQAPYQTEDGPILEMLEELALNNSISEIKVVRSMVILRKGPATAQYPLFSTHGRRGRTFPAL